MIEDRSIEAADSAHRRHLVVGALVGVTRWVAVALDGGGRPGGADVDAADGAPAAELPYVALGLLCAAEERLTDAARTALGAARTVGETVTSMATPLVPGPVRKVVTDAVTELDRHGRRASVAGTDEAARIGRALADGLARQPALVHVIEDIVDRLQWRVVDAVLPVVLDRLAAEPDQVRVIVQGQSRGMVDELARSARSRAVDGDELVDRLVDRVLHGHHPPSRRAREELAAHDALSPGEDAAP